MSEQNFMELLKNQWADGKMVCVGLDPLLEKIPEAAQTVDTEQERFMGLDLETTFFDFCGGIVEATDDLVCAYKPNLQFFLRHGAEGIEVLREIIRFANRTAPEVPIILDAKFGDIGNTNNGSVEFAFDYLGADAVTIHPYMGQEANKPFLDRKDRGIIVLCKTSNSGSGEFQDRSMSAEEKYLHSRQTYVRVAQNVTEKWNTNGNCALVVGATYPIQLAELRELCDYIPLLIPGIGAQGGDVEATVNAGKSKDGTGMIINSSRGIIFASDGDDFAAAARAATIELDQNIRRYAFGD